MARDQQESHRSFRLHGPLRLCVLLVTALALALVVALVWTGVAHPQGDSMRLLDSRMIGGPEGVRRVTAGLLIAACGLVAVTGVVLLALDFRAGRLAAHRLGRHVRQQ